MDELKRLDDAVSGVMWDLQALLDKYYPEGEELDRMFAEAQSVEAKWNDWVMKVKRRIEEVDGKCDRQKQRRLP